MGLFKVASEGVDAHTGLVDCSLQFLQVSASIVVLFGHVDCGCESAIEAVNGQPS
jgi:hypothetical protein